MSPSPFEKWTAFWARLFGAGSGDDVAHSAGAVSGDEPGDDPADGPDKDPDDDPDAGPENELEPYVVTDELDLHGFYPQQVPEVVDEFLRHAVSLGIREVRIAHGKGRSVMKREVWKVLERSPRVIEFREAPPARGGWGATLAWLAVEDRDQGGDA